MGLTAEIGRFVADMSPSRVSPAALASEASGQRGRSISARAGHSPEQGSSARDGVSIVKTGFTDCVAVMIAGWREPVVAVVAELTGGALPEHPFAPGCLRLAASDRAMLYAT